MDLHRPHKQIVIDVVKGNHDTTHRDGFPQDVKIIRNRHPLQGQSLKVLGWTHREGEQPHCLVIYHD
jgi:hypothetical protein